MQRKVWPSALLFWAAFCSLSGQTGVGSTRDSEGLRTFLMAYLKNPNGIVDKATRYVAAFVDLNGSGNQVIVYFTDPHSCGSGGCQTLILNGQGKSFRVVTSLPIGWPPIRVLDTKTNGWHDLSLWVRGGGIRPGYAARLQFDGSTYPRNPSVPPAIPLSGLANGAVVISASAEGTPLYNQ